MGQIKKEFKIFIGFNKKEEIVCLGDRNFSWIIPFPSNK
jgi:hypothetical protein